MFSINKSLGIILSNVLWFSVWVRHSAHDGRRNRCAARRSNHWQTTTGCPRVSFSLSKMSAMFNYFTMQWKSLLFLFFTFRFFVGTVLREKVPVFERVMKFITHSTVFMRTEEIERTFKDPITVSTCCLYCNFSTMFMP